MAGSTRAGLKRQALSKLRVILLRKLTGSVIDRLVETCKASQTAKQKNLPRAYLQRHTEAWRCHRDRVNWSERGARWKLPVNTPITPEDG